MTDTTRLSRRAALAAIGSTAAMPASAQLFDRLLNPAGNVLRGLSTMSELDEVAIGNTLYRPLLDESGGAYANARAQAALRRFAAPLFATSRRANFQWEIAIVDDNAVNAWALPAGKLAINKGLLRYTASEHELAAVIAHEMGHAELSHQVQAIKQDGFTRLLSAAGRDVVASQLRGPGGALTSAGLDALRSPLHQLVQSGYSRDAEREADKHIFTVFRSTGHDPAGAPAFFRTLLELVPPNQEGTTSLFSTHPGTRERLAAVTSEAAKASGGGAASTTAAFNEIKESFPTRRVYRRAT
jgi:predicted Zn-dependent protease